MHHDLTFEQSIGQHVMIGLSGTEVDDAFVDLVRTYKIGNVLLHRRNCEHKEQVRSLCSDIRQLIEQETGREPLIAIAEEGGTVSVLSPDATHIPGAMAISATGDQGNAYTCGRIIAEELRALGIQCNFAPNLAVNSNRMNPVAGIQSYSDNPETVADFAGSTARGLSDGSVAAFCKFFPGHGDTITDEQTGLQVLDKMREELDACELLPFASAVANAIAGVIVGHILVPALETQPIVASLSGSIITELLRNEMGYDGIVCTDYLDSEPIQRQYGVAHAAVEALKAGVDLILLSENHDWVAEVVGAIAESHRNGYLSWEEHQRSQSRIATVKQRFSLRTTNPITVVGSEEHTGIARALMARAVCAGNLPLETLPELGDHPLFLGCIPDIPAQLSGGEAHAALFPHWMANHIGGRSLITPTDPTNEEIIGLMEETKGTSSIIIGTYNGYVQKGQLALANAMAGTGLITVVVALGDPYDLVYLAENIHSFATFEYSPLAFEAIRCILTHERSATGVLPIHW
jgi:beta-N-acetylhexosaminidase